MSRQWHRHNPGFWREGRWRRHPWRVELAYTYWQPVTTLIHRLWERLQR